MVTVFQDIDFAFAYTESEAAAFPGRFDPLGAVMRGLDPRIHHPCKIYARKMDPRVKPAGDGGVSVLSIGMIDKTDLTVMDRRPYQSIR